ncbi:hypothetical protein ACVIWU_001565 [Bradyrhizobium sp. USDA 4509]
MADKRKQKMGSKSGRRSSQKATQKSKQKPAPKNRKKEAAKVAKKPVVDGGSGGYSIAGYEYQIDVSVWLALDLVLANRLTQHLILEPASEEDIEADLEEFESGRITTAATLDGYRLIVQAKLRTGDAWTVAGVKRLLEHGEVRVSAAERLKDPRARYLLVTSAGLNGGAANLRVRHAGIWRKAESMPSTIARVLPSDAAGRVAIIGNEDPERLETDIKRSLREGFRVPNARLEECRKALREAARARIAGAGGGRWTREELERLVRKHEGYIASSPELDNYVKPTNWDDILGTLRKRHAVLLIGQSGTGKTMATRKIYDELKASVPGLTRVPISQGPEQLRDDQTVGPVLYDIEDPWGRYDFDPTSRPWNDLLSHSFAEARHDRLIVATSRLDVATTSGALDTVKPWLVSLEAEHYGRRERRRLYETRIEALPRKLQKPARESEADVLSELATPLEIQKFFDALPTVDEEEFRNPHQIVSEAIRRAHRNSIERTVVDQIEARDDLRAAAVIWGMLKAADRLSLPLLRQLEEQLAGRGEAFQRGVSPLVSFFVAARNLRQVETAVTYYHPWVEAGIEQALKRAEIVARLTLRELIDVLVSLDAEWGSAASARLLFATDRTSGLRAEPSASSQARIDAWLDQELAKAGKGFESNLGLAAAVGSPASNLSEAARYLLHRPERSFPGFMRWGAPEHTEEWYARMRGDAAVKSLVERFVRDVLPESRDDYPSGFAAAIERLAGGLTPAFLAAAAAAVNHGVTHTSDAVADGALNDLAGFEAIVERAIGVLTPSEAERQRYAEIHLAIINGEYSEDYAEHLADDETGYTAREFLEAYVDRVRATTGWARIAQHPHRAHLLSYWFRVLLKQKEPAADEVAGAFAAGYETKFEDDLWHVLTKAWNSTFERPLIQRMLAGHQESSIRTAALIALVERVPQRLGDVVETLSKAENHRRLIQLAIEIGELRHRHARPDGTRHTEAAEQASQNLPPVLREIAEAAFALDKAIPTLSVEAREYLLGVPDVDEDVRLFRVMVDRHVPLPLSDDARWLLANSDESSHAVEGLDFAIRHGMEADIMAALSHRFADVVAGALKVLPRALPLPPDILAMVEAKGSPVRLALVDLLDARPHPSHMPALLHLAKDDWSPRANYYGEEADYPIALKAVRAMAKLGKIDDDPAGELYRVAIDTRDFDLRYEIFFLLARSAGEQFQDRLFELAINPGTRDVRIRAADALLVASEFVVPKLLEAITSQLVTTKIEVVASRLLLLLAFRGDIDRLLRCAESLATHEKRRVLLLLAIWAVRERDFATAERIANMLPTNHVAAKWALAGGIGKLSDAALDDLGDPISVEQVHFFMTRESKKR